MLGKAFVILGIVLTLSQASRASDFYMTPSGAGSGDGSSWSNARPQSQLERTLDTDMQPGDVLHLGSGIYSQAIHIDSSGSAPSLKRVVGESTGGGLPIFDMGTWSPSPNPATGPPFAISFGNGAGYWTIENLIIQDVVHGIRTDNTNTALCVGITLRSLTLRNCRYAIGISDARNWLIENVKATEYTKHGFRFDHNCVDVTVRNCTADLSGGDVAWYNYAEGFPFGFLVDDPNAPNDTDFGSGPPSSNITFEDCLAQHHRKNGQDSTDYWNGDGFVVNQNNDPFFKFVRCRALDNEDGGFDIKEDAKMNDCIAFHNKRNFRFHSGASSMSNCVSGYPLKRGGAFGFGGVWVHDATLTLNYSTIHGSEWSAVEEDGSGQVTLNNSILSSDGTTGKPTIGNVTLGSTTVTYSTGSGVDPQYVNPRADWNGVGSDMNSNTYGSTKGYFQDLDSSPVISDHQIVQTLFAPTIDGLVDSNWSAVSRRAIGNVVVGSVTDDNDLSGGFRAQWDDENLYLLVDVKDEAQQNDSGTQTWNDDSMEIYIDGDKDGQGTYGANDFQYRFVWTGTSLTILEIKHGATTGVVASRFATGNGYVFEVKLPWSTLSQNSVAVGALLGLDVHVNDDDNGGERDSKRAWFNTMDTSWQNPSTFATARLTGIGADQEIVQTDTAPSIDGNVEPAWSFANRQTIRNVVVGSVANDNDLSGTFRTLWDAENLYLQVQVIDDAQRNDSGTQTWNDDSVEIYIDGDKDGQGTYGANDFQYRFTWTGTSLSIQETKHNAITGITASRVVTANGYIVEVKLPWSTMGQSSVTVGALLGLDVHINDDDDGGSRDGKKAGFNTEDTSWLNPSTFATARLVGIR